MNKTIIADIFSFAFYYLVSTNGDDEGIMLYPEEIMNRLNQEVNMNKSIKRLKRIFKIVHNYCKRKKIDIVLYYF